jgi:hypothetical protein
VLVDVVEYVFASDSTARARADEHIDIDSVIVDQPAHDG